MIEAAKMSSRDPSSNSGIELHISNRATVPPIRKQKKWSAQDHARAYVRIACGTLSLETRYRTRAETAAWLASQVTELRSWLGFFFSTFPNRTAVFHTGTPTSLRG